MSRGHTSVSKRQIAAIVLAAAASLLVAIRYAQLIKPAAAREVKAACRGLQPSADNPVFGQLPSSQAVDFTAYNYQGEAVRLSDFRGKVVFVNFWATWCNVCKTEKPSLESMAQELESDDFVILTLASNRTWDEIRAYYPNGSPLRVLLDPPANDENLGVISKSFGITAVPESFVIDRSGRVRYYFINKRDWSASVVETCLAALIDE